MRIICLIGIAVTVFTIWNAYDAGVPLWTHTALLCAWIIALLGWDAAERQHAVLEKILREPAGE